MTITSVASATFLADAINLIKNKLIENIEDPIAPSRRSNEKFVLTAYPKRPVTYPIITIKDKGINQMSRQGMASEGTFISLNIEVRIWATTSVQREQLFDAIYDYLRQNQLEATTGLSDSNLHDFTLSSAVNIDEEGEAGIHSKVCIYKFVIIIS